jgi:hypothetical protein
LKQVAGGLGAIVVEAEAASEALPLVKALKQSVAEAQAMTNGGASTRLAKSLRKRGRRTA